MTTLDMVDSELRPMLDLITRMELSDETLAQTREALNAPRPDMPDPVIQPRRETAPGRDGAPSVPLLIFDPPGRTARGAILHMHGGGMVMGTAGMSTLANAALATRLGVLVVSVDYRLSPETAFPGPQEDCYAVLEWLWAQADMLGVDLDRIVLLGESAGGQLAAALALMVRDRGGRPLAGQALVYPMLDYRTGSDACPHGNLHSGEFVWTRESNRYGWSSLKGAYALDDDRIGWFSPACAVSLTGLAPAFIATGALDLFVDEDIDYARRLGVAGVPVELHVYPGAIHGFDMMATARVARQLRSDTDRALAVMLGLTPA